MNLSNKYLRCILSLIIVGLFSVAGLCSVNAQASDRTKQVYNLCISCHAEQGQGNQELAAPAIAGLPAWYIEKQLYNFRKGVRGLHPSDEPGMRMRPMARTLSNDDDIKKVSEYVSKLPRPNLKATVEGSPVNGMEQYAVCSACHGPKGGGNQALGAPPLVGSSDWYLLTQLKNFKSGIRGANAAIDPMGATMAPMAAVIADEQTMKDIISYIQKLR